MSILRVSSVKTQLFYCQIRWRHVSTQGVIIRPIIEPCLRCINWKCTFLGFQNVYNSERTWVQIRLMFRIFFMCVCIYIYIYIYIYTGCPRRKGQNFGRVFLMLKYTDITQNTYFHSWTVTEIMAREKCGLLAGPRTVPVSWQVLSMFVLESGVI